ncbi:hypothetical protein KAW18_01245 [candidate division WOR-3 bacterium]|nr:hypothetical protein [candidate division WOR-3 bacterium]
MAKEQQPAEPLESVSQEIAGVIDTGADSFTVDNTPTPVEGKTGDSLAEEKPGEEPEEKPGETSTETPGEKPVSDEDLPKGVQKRLATVTRKRRDAERTAATLQAQNQELFARIEALEHPERESGEAPQVDDFDTEEEYLEAVSDYKADQKIAEREANQEANQAEEIRKGQEAEAAARQDALRKNLQKGVEKFKDFEDVIEDLNITGDMINILETLPNIPEVAYTLGSNPDTVEELVGLPYLQAAYRMKEISDGLSKKKKTKAPNPITPVSTTGGMVKSLEQMTQAEYNAHMNARDKERRGLI